MKVLLSVFGIALITLSANPAHASTHNARHSSAIPHGFTLDGLQDWLPPRAAFDRNVALSPGRIAFMEEQIHAARYSWNANVVRFQIVQDKLVGTNGQVFSPVYMQDIRTVTDYALSLGLQVVLNAQTEVASGFTRNEPLPTAATWSFWQHIMTYYKNNPRVIFDLFNEPRKCSWAQWHRAMQGLLDHVRHSGARNTVWAEGRWWGSTLAGVPLLHGTGIVYSFHHPGSPWPGQAPVTRKTWDRAFGNLARRGIPVVDGEFVNYSGGYHWKNPAVKVRKYLRYLTAHHIGMTAWTLGLPGVMNSTANLASATTEPHGCGQLIKSWFLRMSPARA
jgi:hypothetical protein